MNGLTTRAAPRKAAQEIKRRLALENRGAVLIADSVKIVPIPQTQYQATVFVFAIKKRFVFVAELVRPGLPHIFSNFVADGDDPKENFENLLVALESLRKRIVTDSRFDNRIVLSSAGGLN